LSPCLVRHLAALRGAVATETTKVIQLREEFATVEASFRKRRV
jgi:hypothetical protein